MAEGSSPESGANDDGSFPPQSPPIADLGPRVLAAAGWTVFLLIAIDYVGTRVLQPLDEFVLEAVPRSGLLVEASSLITHLGYNVTLGAFALLGVLFLMRWRRFVDAGVLAFGTAASAVIVSGLKHVFARMRPAVGDMTGVCCAFPSGHASGSAVVFMMLAVLLFEHRPRLRPWAEGVAVGLAIVIAATRVVIGVHWATDVVAGVGLGWGLAGTFLLLRLYLHRRFPLPAPVGRAKPSASKTAMAEVQPVKPAPEARGGADVPGRRRERNSS